MDIILIRHGETQDNISKVYSRDSSGLTAKGRCQAEMAKEKIKGLDFEEVYYSPLRRTEETLELLGLVGRPEPRIREMNFGVFSGKTYHQIVKMHPKESKKWFEDSISYGIPGGESLEVVYNRLAEFLHELEARDKNALLVTHEGIIRLACCWVFDDINHFYRFKADNGSLSIISVHKGYKYISKLNATDRTL